MFTYDEWGNTVFHILIGKGGIEMLEKIGIKNTMTPEEYKKHMESYRKLRRKRDEEIWKQLEEIFK